MYVLLILRPCNVIAREIWLGFAWWWWLRVWQKGPMNIPHIPIHKTTKAPATNHRVINKPGINKRTCATCARGGSETCNLRFIFSVWRFHSFVVWVFDHFTVMDGSEAEGDLVLIQTFFALLWKLFLKNTSKHKNDLIYIIKQEGLYQSKVTLSLASTHNCKIA